MAWISVHEDVFGQKLRKLAKGIGCSQAESLGILNALWLWGLKNAEKSGEIKDADIHDVAGAIPVGILSKGLDTLKIVKAMVSTGWIDDVGGVLFLHDWEDWQEQWYKFLDRKAYDAKRKRDKRRQEREAEDAPEEEPDGKTAGALPEGDEPKGDKPKKEKKDDKPKKKYAEFVHMTEDEYEKLVKRFGRLAAEKAVEMLDNYKGQNNKRYASDYRAMNQAKLLIIDDLGAERSTDFALEKVYNIIDSRYRAKKPLILTTNLTMAEMKEATDIRYSRIYDRIFEICYPIGFTGQSWRKGEAARRFDEMKQFLEG